MKVFSPPCVDSMLGNIHAEIKKTRASGMFEKRIKGHQNLNQSRINYSNDVHCTGIVVISYIAITLKKITVCSLLSKL